MKKLTRLAALALCLALICSLLPQVSLIAHAATYSGTCGAEGDNLTWTLDTETGLLTIEGSGEMADYGRLPFAPWYDEGAIITAISFPEGLTYIGEFAFHECSALTELTFPESLTEIGYGAFDNCTGLHTVVFPEALKKIGDYAFFECAALTAVTIPAGVKSIGRGAFVGCTSLTQINVAPENAKYSSRDGVLFNAAETYLIQYPVGRTDTAYAVPEGVKSIGEEAFEYCSSLSSVSFPEGLRGIGMAAFCDCTGLTELSFREGPLNIGWFAFYGCSGLTSVTLPNGVSEIGDWTFEHCTALTEVTLPDGLRRIGLGAFKNCDALRSVTIPASVNTIFNEAFGYYGDEETGEFGKVENFTIYGVKGSVAQNYAEENDFTFVPQTGNNPFEDVHEDDLFFTPVMWAVSGSVSRGVDDTHFAPERTVMRSDAMVFLWAANGRPEFTATDKTFKDVKETHWAYKAVMWAVENGITGGTNTAGTEFSPSRTCSRSEILQFLYAAMGKPGYSIENPYSDVNDRHWYKDGAIWAFENGLEKGESGEFHAKTPCTRGYVVTYLYRYFTGLELAE